MHFANVNPEGEARRRVYILANRPLFTCRPTRETREGESAYASQGEEGKETTTTPRGLAGDGAGFGMQNRHSAMRSRWRQIPAAPPSSSTRRRVTVSVWRGVACRARLE